MSQWKRFPLGALYQSKRDNLTEPDIDVFSGDIVEIKLHNGSSYMAHYIPSQEVILRNGKECTIDGYFLGIAITDARPVMKVFNTNNVAYYRMQGDIYHGCKTGRR